ncbi:hypothetical protein D9757_013608 [Collybiopsis confluens]|uniref:Uncharacterized protein n=1 Tax=Collybiopsis confluens TaxID=2823264 RepID=A0A8H5LL20_9AGAR|nr:hypothetical protein D9757_013608 [Collybiopsis confluens]
MNPLSGFLNFIKNRFKSSQSGAVESSNSRPLIEKKPAPSSFMSRPKANSAAVDPIPFHGAGGYYYYSSQPPPGFNYSSYPAPPVASHNPSQNPARLNKRPAGKDMQKLPKKLARSKGHTQVKDADQYEPSDSSLSDNSDYNHTSELSKSNTGFPPGIPSAVPSTDIGFWNMETKYIQFSELTNGWDRWPQGNWYMDISPSVFQETEELAVHWACRNNGGKQVKNASATAQTIFKEEQLLNKCRCGTGHLVHYKCENKAQIVRWAGGVRYYNGTHDHNHPHIPITHLTLGEKKKLISLVKANPKSAPAALLSGNTVDGSSTADISDALIHSGRVSRYRSQILGTAHQKDDNGFLRAYSQFQKDYPGFIIGSTMQGGVIVVSAQTPFMASQLHVDGFSISGPFNGIVSDAAHNWWKDQSALLIISSIFSEILQQWIPALISYSNGASAGHFEYHFLTLMETIARIATERKKDVNDELFTGIIDFSQAERLGFSQAFMRFWRSRGDNRSDEELFSKAGTLLKGCWQHFSSSVTRVKRITAIVQPSSRTRFERLAKSLQNAELPEFIETCTTIRSEFPRLKEWLNWWLQPEHAEMLFVSRRRMPERLWSALPETTNAEEAMHFSMYSQQGRKHGFIDGWIALKKIADTFQRKYNAASVGQPLHWGKTDLQRRNKLKAEIGRTKRSRSKPKIRARRQRYVNDGRPKDDHRLLRTQRRTQNSQQDAQDDEVEKGSEDEAEEWGESEIGEWAGITASSTTEPPAKRPRKAAAQSLSQSRNNSLSSRTDISLPSPPDPLLKHSRQALLDGAPRDFALTQGLLTISKRLPSLPSYQWARNSCWLDTSLELIFYGLNYCWPNIEALFENHPLHRFYPVFKSLQARRLLLLGNPKETKILISDLKDQREQMRKYIKTTFSERDGNIYDMDTPFSWFTSALEISHILRKTHKRKLEAHELLAYQYFGMECITLKLCMGGDTTSNSKPCYAHVQLQPPHPGPSPRCTAGPTAEKWSLFKGNIQSWIRSLTDPAHVHCESLKHCWCTENKPFHACTGDAHCINISTSLPAFWIIDQDISSGTSLNAEPWSFPRTLYPVKGKEAKDKGFCYEMVGRVFFGRSHFVGRFIVPTDTPTQQPAVYFYDGMKNNGQAVKETGGQKTLLEGALPQLPTGYEQFRSYAVIYRLVGGKKAQEWFSDRQHKLIKKHLSITYKDSSFVPALNLPSALYSNPEFAVRSLTNCSWLTDVALKGLEKNAIPPVDYDQILSSSPANTEVASTASSYYSADENRAGGTPDTTEQDNKTDSGSFSIPNPAERSPLSDYSDIIDELTGEGAHSSTSSHILSSSPAPSDEAHVVCRCGIETDGHRQEVQETLIQCTFCDYYWSHRACQTYRTTSVIRNFMCPVCALESPGKLKALQDQVIRTRKSSRSASATAADISSRLFDGKGVLIKDKEFYYPARLLQKLPRNRWSFRWWRHNIPAPGSLQIPGKEDITSINNIVDELWGNRAARRKIRLGLWKRAHLVDEAQEDDDRKDYKEPTSEIDRALRPHKDVLRQLMDSPASVKLPIPAKEFVEQGKHQGTVFGYSGGLTKDDCARINGWFRDKIPGAQNKGISWYCTLPIAHARTLVLAHCHGPELGSKSSTETDILRHAFSRLVGWTGLTIDGKKKPQEKYDVDLEALRILEKLIFDVSESAGEAGNHQWGLDAGSHQRNWNPWTLDAPESWATDRRYGDNDTELETGPEFKDDQAIAAAEKKIIVPRPKPKPLTRRVKQN